MRQVFMAPRAARSQHSYIKVFRILRLGKQQTEWNNGQTEAARKWQKEDKGLQLSHIQIKIQKRVNNWHCLIPLGTGQNSESKGQNPCQLLNGMKRATTWSPL